MKKIQKKLTLKKKTIAQLSEQTLNNDKQKKVVGGFTYTYCSCYNTSCDCHNNCPPTTYGGPC